MTVTIDNLQQQGLTDGTFTITTDNQDLKYVLIEFDNTFINAVGTNCMEKSGSSVFVVTCYLDTTNHRIFMEIFPKTYGSAPLQIVTMRNSLKILKAPGTYPVNYKVKMFHQDSPVPTWTDTGYLSYSVTTSISHIIGSTYASIPAPSYISYAEGKYTDNEIYPWADTVHTMIRFDFVAPATYTQAKLEANVTGLFKDPTSTFLDMTRNIMLCTVNNVNYTCSMTGTVVLIDKVDLTTGTTYKVRIGVNDPKSLSVSGFSSNPNVVTRLRFKIITGAGVTDYYIDSPFQLLRPSIIPFPFFHFLFFSNVYQCGYQPQLLHDHKPLARKCVQICLYPFRCNFRPNFN